MNSFDSDPDLAPLHDEGGPRALSNGVKTVRALILIMIISPFMMFWWAHLVRPLWPDTVWLGIAAMVLVGLVGVATAPWNGAVRGMVTVCFLAVAAVSAPYLGLLAVCSTGDCL